MMALDFSVTPPPPPTLQKEKMGIHKLLNANLNKCTEMLLMEVYWNH